MVVESQHKRILEAFGCGFKWEFTDTRFMSCFTLRNDLWTHLLWQASVVKIVGYGYALIFYVWIVYLVVLDKFDILVEN